MVNNSPVKVFTIGFTQKKAEDFFTILQNANVRVLYDIRLNNASQLAGFTKMDDLKYFLKTIANIKYAYISNCAPTKNLLDAYKKKKITWNDYEDSFNALITQRHIEKSVTIENLNYACFLCSEPKPQKCHRRLVVEYLKKYFPEIQICHL